MPAKRCCSILSAILCLYFPMSFALIYTAKVRLFLFISSFGTFSFPHSAEFCFLIRQNFISSFGIYFFNSTKSPSISISPVMYSAGMVKRLFLKRFAGKTTSPEGLPL